MSRFLVLIIVVLVGLLLLAVGLNSGTSWDGDDTAHLVYTAMWAVLLGSGILASRRNLGEAARQLGVWALITVVLVAAYVYRQDAQSFASRMTAGLIPGRAMTSTDANGVNTVTLYRGRNGHFQAQATVNGITIPMMVDTGATTIALTFEDAKALGLDPAGLSFTAQVMTANGPALMANVTLPEIEIGGIRRSNVRAGVAEAGKLSESLLGMSFLGSLSSFSFSGEELTLKD